MKKTKNKGKLYFYDLAYSFFDVERKFKPSQPFFWRPLLPSVNKLKRQSPTYSKFYRELGGFYVENISKKTKKGRARKLSILILR